MRRYNSEKRNRYYDEVIRLYTQEGLGSSKISRIIPVGRTTITSWIRNFADENEVQVVMERKSSIIADSPMTSVESTDVKILQAEIARLKKELAHESPRADAFNELINVAEKQFNISIRKKLAPSSKEPACSRLSPLSGRESLQAVWRHEAGLL